MHNRRPGTLPVAQNSPQKCKYDLYAEGVSCLSVFELVLRANRGCLIDDGGVLRRSARGELQRVALPHPPIGRAPGLRAPAGQPRRT